MAWVSSGWQRAAVLALPPLRTNHRLQQRVPCPANAHGRCLALIFRALRHFPSIVFPKFFNVVVVVFLAGRLAYAFLYFFFTFYQRCWCTPSQLEATIVGYGDNDN
jgi:hypothetical protein